MATNQTKQTTKKNKHMDNYALIMVPKDVHATLKAYCDEHGYKMAGLVSNLIRKHCK
jgi:peroxiredoxin